MPQIEKYGRLWPEGMTDLTIELLAFREGLSLDQGGLGKEQHFWNVVEALWPYHPKKESTGVSTKPLGGRTTFSFMQVELPRDLWAKIIRQNRSGWIVGFD